MGKENRAIGNELLDSKRRDDSGRENTQRTRAGQSYFKK
jgi:hypothetical protein